jgi:hypothetical protein
MLQHEKLAMHGISLKKWARHRREKQATQHVHVPADPPKRKVAAPEPEAYIVDKVIDVKMEGKDKLYLVQLKGFSALHNTEFATKGIGMRGMDARLSFNTPLHVRHIDNLANMAKQGLFVYKGRGNAADATFVSGECAMATGSSALYGNVVRNGKFAYDQCGEEDKIGDPLETEPSFDRDPSCFVHDFAENKDSNDGYDGRQYRFHHGCRSAGHLY